MASSEHRELELIEKVNLRILNVANDGQKLGQLLKTYLPPLLLKAGSDHASVRTKVVTICQRLRVFIKSPDIVLPVAALLEQYTQNTHPVIRQLDITFIQHSFERIKADERRQLVPAILSRIHQVTHTSPARFHLFLHALDVINVPPRGTKDDEAFRTAIGLSDPRDAAFVASWLGKLLLLTTATHRRAMGLDEADVNFLTMAKPGETWSAASALDLTRTKIKATRLLESDAFTDEERFMPSIYAAASNDYRVNSVGDAMLMRSKVSLEDETRVAALFEAHARLPPVYRIRILNLLSRSAASTAFTRQILDLVRRDMRTHEETRDPPPSSSTLPSSQEIADGGTAGLQLTKLHSALFEYINWVARIGPGKGHDFTVGPTLIGFLRTFITEEQGWPKPDAEKRSLSSIDDRILRARAYETIGVLAKGSPMEEAELLELVPWLFQSLSEDPTPDVVVNIEGALSVMTSRFTPNSCEIDRLRVILLTYMTLPDGGAVVRSVRHAATKWANHCLALSDPIARWVDILAIHGRADERIEVVEEGHKGLDPWTHRLSDAGIPSDLPDWQVMVQRFFNEPIGYASSTTMGEDGSPLMQNFADLAPTAFPTAITYCKRVMLLTALKDDFIIEPGWEQQLALLVKTDKQTRNTIRKYLASLAGRALETLLRTALEGTQEDKPFTEECATTFVEVGSLAPKATLASLTVSALPRLLAVVKSNNKDVRTMAARALGILATHPSVPVSLFSMVNAILRHYCKSWQSAVGADLNAAQGSFLALAHLWSRALYYPHPKIFPDAVESTEATDQCGDPSDAADVLAELRKRYFNKGLDDPPRVMEPRAEEWLPPVHELASAMTSTQEAILDTLTQLWTASIMPEAASIIPYMDMMILLCKKGNERAITAMGRLALGLGDEASILDTILRTFYELHELKQVEVHFAIGEAIASAVGRWDSDVVQLTVDVESSCSGYRKAKRANKIREVLDKILADCKSTKPSLLKASGVWLFCIIQHCSQLPEIQTRLRECQVAFMRLLSARDELVQETASRGLALVYEKGDGSLKEDLVQDLVGAFTGSGTQLKVEEDTELFEAGALPTGDGKSVTSYKDIINLANEVGDQSLVYKFMSLASNAATWSTRSAFGRFGLSNILSESEVDPKLYPKLYRYRFDPNPNVQRSMTDIWKALVKDSNTVMEAHFDSIISDLLKSIHAREWRVRQASCAAISDLISGKPFHLYGKYYSDIWTKALKVLDDVKATVRDEALKLCMGMANTLTRQLEEGAGGASASARARDMMNSTLPFLLSDKGIESNVDEIKSFAIETVIKITNTGGSTLGPYIATIVTHLLGLLSTVEPDAINYYYQRFGEDEREKMDKIRSQMVNQSPISQAIENCLRSSSIDGGVMADLASGLEETIKTGLGMPTKVGCARLLGTLATRHTTDFQPYAKRFLRLLEKQCLDRNDEVSQGYARAAAYMMRHAPSDAREKFINKFENLYFSAEDEMCREKVADVVLSLSKISPDHFNSLEGSLLPFSYLGMHDTDDYVAKAFKEVWETHAGSSRTAATRFVPEIASLAQRSMDTGQWSLKHAGALTSSSAVQAITATGDLAGSTVKVAQLKQLWPVFEKALGLKTFSGKEKLLEALADLTAKGGVFWGSDGEVAKQLRTVTVREAKRNNEAYRVHAFECLWRCAAAREDVDLWEEIVCIVKPYLDEYADEDRMVVDGEGGKQIIEKEMGVYKTARAAVEAVARGWNRPRLRREPLEVLGSVLDVLKRYLGRPKFDPIRREVWYECVEEIADEAFKHGAATGDGAQILEGVFESLDVHEPDLGLETQRLARARATVCLVKAAKKGVFGSAEGTVGKIRASIAEARERERSMDVKKVMGEALGAL